VVGEDSVWWDMQGEAFRDSAAWDRAALAEGTALIFSSCKDTMTLPKHAETYCI